MRWLQLGRIEAHHTVATPYLREVNTAVVSLRTWVVRIGEVYLRDYRTWRYIRYESKDWTGAIIQYECETAKTQGEESSGGDV
jgi:hypothetical protein